MKKAKIIDKIKKLLALSESPNENEAAAAVVKARELLDRHNLTLAEVETLTAEDPLIIRARMGTGYKHLPVWLIYLGAVVEKPFDCVALHSSGELSFCGTETDAEVALYTFTYLYRAIWDCWLIHREELKADQRWKRKKRPGVYRQSFLMGAVTAVDETLRRHLKSDRRRAQYASPHCRALVLRKGQAIEKYLENLNIRRSKEQNLNMDDDGLYAGYHEGKWIQIRTGIAHPSTLGLAR